jgi:hypothetical protein
MLRFERSDESSNLSEPTRKMKNMKVDERKTDE